MCHWPGVLNIAANQSVPLTCGVGHNSQLERATNLRCRPYQPIRATVTLAPSWSDPWNWKRSGLALVEDGARHVARSSSLTTSTTQATKLQMERLACALRVRLAPNLLLSHRNGSVRKAALEAFESALSETLNFIAGKTPRSPVAIGLSHTQTKYLSTCQN